MLRMMRGFIVLAAIFFALAVQAQDFAAVKQAAEQGDAKSQFKLGMMYDEGQGMAQDYAEAMKWFRKAAEQGDVSAQIYLGLMYSGGLGVAKDYAETVKWYRKAAEQGDANAQGILGAMYSAGLGVAQDYAEAMKWYRKAAEQGDASAQGILGSMYAEGQGVAQDYAEAMKWYRKAAEQGDANAQFNLGLMHAEGQGVVQDYAEAMKWYRKAAEQGYKDAQVALEAMGNLSSPAAQQDPNSLELFRVKLKNATRAQVRAAFKKSPLQIEREEDNYGVDFYRSSAALEGSSQLAMGYTDKGQFAYAEYTFPSHMDTQQVQRVVDMVAAKYGKPGKFSGSGGLGEVKAIWQKGQNMSIKVYRGWLDTTTYLRFSDSGAEKQMNAEIEAEKAAKTRRKAASQTQAF